jgi:hypothetical protein
MVKMLFSKNSVRDRGWDTVIYQWSLSGVSFFNGFQGVRPNPKPHKTIKERAPHILTELRQLQQLLRPPFTLTVLDNNTEASHFTNLLSKPPEPYYISTYSHMWLKEKAKNKRKNNHKLYICVFILLLSW